ncbi:MAG: hypothetical protein FWE09_04765 [Treponema sp.]|nr:hypothetical protein [Treponema sp.]
MDHLLFETTSIGNPLYIFKSTNALYYDWQISGAEDGGLEITLARGKSNGWHANGISRVFVRFNHYVELERESGGYLWNDKRGLIEKTDGPGNFAAINLSALPPLPPGMDYALFDSDGNAVGKDYWFHEIALTLDGSEDIDGARISAETSEPGLFWLGHEMTARIARKDEGFAFSVTFASTFDLFPREFVLAFDAGDEGEIALRGDFTAHDFDLGTFSVELFDDDGDSIVIENISLNMGLFNQQRYCYARPYMKERALLHGMFAALAIMGEIVALWRDDFASEF